MNKVIMLPPNKQNQMLEFMPKQSTLLKLAEFFSVFSDATRIKILTALTISEMCVNDIANLLQLNQTTVSHQLKFLRHSGAVCQRRNGKLIYYSICDSNIHEVLLNGVNFLIEAETMGQNEWTSFFWFQVNQKHF